MDILSKFVDMAKSPVELADEVNQQISPVAASQNIYPYGLCICLTQEELDKLNLSDDVDAGDTVHLHALAKVTCVNKSDTTSGTKTRVELQITHLAAEDEGNDEVEPPPRRRIDYNKLYE